MGYEPQECIPVLTRANALSASFPPEGSRSSHEASPPEYGSQVTCLHPSIALQKSFTATATSLPLLELVKPLACVVILEYIAAICNVVVTGHNVAVQVLNLLQLWHDADWHPKRGGPLSEVDLLASLEVGPPGKSTPLPHFGDTAMALDCLLQVISFIAENLGAEASRG